LTTGALAKKRKKKTTLEIRTVIWAEPCGETLQAFFHWVTTLLYGWYPRGHKKGGVTFKFYKM
jgi:hypothetical protein